MLTLFWESFALESSLVNPYKWEVGKRSAFFCSSCRLHLSLASSIPTNERGGREAVFCCWILSAFYKPKNAFAQAPPNEKEHQKKNVVKKILFMDLQSESCKSWFACYVSWRCEEGFETPTTTTTSSSSRSQHGQVLGDDQQPQRRCLRRTKWRRSSISLQEILRIFHHPRNLLLDRIQVSSKCRKWWKGLIIVKVNWCEILLFPWEGKHETIVDMFDCEVASVS